MKDNDNVVIVQGEFAGVVARFKQERFAAVVEQYERLRAQMSEAERQGELLFNSLLERSFAHEA